MRLMAAQAVRPINREASQAERRRFESGHPLATITHNLRSQEQVVRSALLISLEPENLDLR